MSNLLAIDVGYSHVKAVTKDSKVIIPSIVSPARDLPIQDLIENTGYSISYQKFPMASVKYFVGELAGREGYGATFTSDREKYNHPNHEILICTAARLLEAECGATLVVGLPIAYYKYQKEEMRKHIEGIDAYVSIGEQRYERIKFGRIIIYPQGAGALLTAPELPVNGRVLLIDVGQKTTDFVTVEVVNGVVKPIATLCGSIEIAVSNVCEAFAIEFQSMTGSPISPIKVNQIVFGTGAEVFNGKEYNFNPVINTIKESVSRAIYDQIRAILGEQFSFLRKIYLAGGGTIALPLLQNLFRGSMVMPEPQWSNAKGFLSIGESN